MVADHLISGSALVYNHRDYCGIGLYYSKDSEEFIMGPADGGAIMGAEKTWHTKPEFVAWLSTQSDSTLYGDGNQRICRARLLEWLPSAQVDRLVPTDALVAEFVKLSKETEEATKEAEAAHAAQMAADALAAEEEKKAQIAASAAKEKQKIEDALAVDDASLGSMSKQDIIALIRLVAPPDSPVLQSNVRVLMSPMSTKDEVIALWKQVKAATASGS
eukprot:gnl/TRDRNA2_/TRDRNA2_63653_c0_seq1.p1 gnl/TRDRNA2_/TRDRNA2_63653_c0~~gnl/TRDRNA2_/TRDRNA2_63653_c0_seq1.p1  ORF type:complete len:253 (-),score=65.61 gnl/TRDRNA2_/TRDRNA2_63653_c0_seq1:91-744(-)